MWVLLVSMVNPSNGDFSGVKRLSVGLATIKLNKNTHNPPVTTAARSFLLNRHTHPRGNPTTLILHTGALLCHNKLTAFYGVGEK